MLPDTSLKPRWPMVLAVLTALFVAVLTMVSIPSRADPPTTGTNTPATAEPVSTIDRDLLVALQQHGLWAAPVGQQAQQMASNPEIRALGQTFATDLGSLSGQVHEVAHQLGVTLPSLPNSQQQNWAAQISGKSGADYDRAMVDRLRAGCTAMAEVIEQARVQTRNERVRQLADHAAGMVNRHLASLDASRASLNPVPYGATPDAVATSLGGAPTTGSSWTDNTLAVLLVTVAGAGTVFGFARFAYRNLGHTRSRLNGRRSGKRW